MLCEFNCEELEDLRDGVITNIEEWGRADVDWARRQSFLVEKLTRLIDNYITQHAREDQ